jgi:uncharacterized protein (DUF58 family)
MSENTTIQSTPTRELKTLRDLLDPELMGRLDRLDLLSRKIFLGKLRGEKRSKRRGQSVEFADHRSYVTGDDLRFIDWNIYGRLDKLFLKLFLEEEDLCLHLVVDVSESMMQGEPAKTYSAKRLAAALGYIGLVNNNRVTVTLFSEGIVAQKANLRGRHRLAEMAQVLIGCEDGGTTAFEKVTKQIALTRIGKGVMVVISDFLMKQGYEQAMKYLAGNSYDVYTIQMLSPQELEPTLAGDLKLRDVEDDDIAEVTISAPLIKRYKATLEAFCLQLQEFCSRRGMSYLRTASDTAVDTLVLDYLRRRGLLR